MRFDRDILFARKRVRASAWLTLLSLALVQLSLASHQFDHAATELVDHCEVCVQLERLDDAASGHVLPGLAALPGPEMELPAPDSHTPAVEAGAYRSRAPPLT